MLPINITIIRLNQPLFDRLFRLRPIKWQKIFLLLTIKALFQRAALALVVADGITRELCIGMHLTAKEV